MNFESVVVHVHCLEEGLTFACLLPSFFALVSTLAFFMTSVNVLQDIEKDKDAAEEELGMECIMSLLGIGHLLSKLLQSLLVSMSKKVN